MARPRIEIELTTKGASAVQTVLGGVLSSVKSWVSGLGAVMGAALSVRELTRGIGEVVNALDSAGAAAQKFGVGVKDLSTLGYAATISKANVEQLQTGLKFLNRSIYEAASGAQEYANAYDTLGVSVRNSDGSLRTSNEILLALADRAPRKLPRSPAPLFGTGYRSRRPNARASARAPIATAAPPNQPSATTHTLNSKHRVRRGPVENAVAHMDE